MNFYTVQNILPTQLLHMAMEKLRGKLKREETAKTRKMYANGDDGDGSGDGG